MNFVVWETLEGDGRYGVMSSDVLFEEAPSSRYMENGLQCGLRVDFRKPVKKILCSQEGG